MIRLIGVICWLFRRFGWCVFFFHFCLSENTLKIANESIQIKGPLCPEALTSQQFRQISDDAKGGKKAKGEWIFTINMHSIHWSYSQQRKCDLDAVPSREMKIGVNDTVSWLPKVPTVLFNSKFSWFEQIQSFFLTSTDFFFHCNHSGKEFNCVKKSIK